LSDYPYLFDGPVDLIQVSDGYLDARLIARSGALQADFERADLSLSLQAEPNPEHDTLFVGTFSKLERVQDYLTQAGITVTLVMTDDMVEADSEALTEPESEAEATATPAAEGEEAAPPEEAAEEPAEVTIEEIPDESELAEESDETQPQSQIEVFGLGKIGLEGTSLFVVDETADHLVVIALAEDGTAAIGALEQLAKGDFSSCVMGQSVTVCSTGEVQNGQGLDLSRQAEAEDASAQKRIFLLSDDDGANGSRTSALDMALLLGDDYEVTVWSTSADGPPSPEAAEGYDLYVIDSGDYAFEQADFDNFFALAGILQNVVVIGQQPFMSVDQTFAPINDVTVVATDHPLAQGLPAEIIPLAPVESGNAALVISADDNAFQDGEVVLARGPNSDEADSAATIAVGDEDGSHFVVIPFAFYRLPEEVQETFLTNIIDWVFAE
jgi:hypothetical protein